MSDQWKMNRMGFVNFWLYDEETFSFADGKLLLRGQNGSGKSITTQSFIPFILDGDRTPSRLDPFGSSDRKMEYYFLGEEGKDESTGYLYLEFWKESTNEYRTIGIGQRAQRGKPMGFWGFVVLDGRRIGYDFWLYREVGGARIPYTRQELKKILGEQTPFTNVPGEYKSLVNNYIFGFKRMEQYEQFIRLLVKVRAPKLSKEFKPTKVYEILNESLQTLTDEDLRAMVDAMEKMDGIQSSLEHLRQAFKDVQILRVEYTRYNQFMVAKKAQAYLDERGMVKKWQNRLETDQARQREMEDEQAGCETLRDKLTQDIRLYDTEMESLGETDLDSVSEKLTANRAKITEVRGQAAIWEGKIEKSREQIRECDAKRQILEKAIDYARYQLNKSKSELDELQETLQFEQHGRVSQWIAGERCEDAAFMRQCLKELKNQIAEGERVLQEQEVIAGQYDKAAEELAERRKKLDQVLGEQELAMQAEDHARDTLIEYHHKLAKESREWKPDREKLAALERAVAEYHDISMAASYRNLTADILKHLQMPIQKSREEADQNIATRQSEVQTLEGELEALRNKKELEPARKSLTEAARETLAGAGIRFVPFYRAVEFAPGLNAEDCALLEMQLADAGLLDALVVSKKDRDRVLAEFSQLSDVIVCVSGTGGRAFDKLTVNEELEDELKEEAERILCNLCEDEGKTAEDERMILRRDGFFCNGILMGHSIAQEEAGFVGRLARKRKREQMILALEEQLDEGKAALDELIKVRDMALERLSVLDEEFQKVPDLGILDQAMAAVRQLKWQEEQETENFKKAERAEQELLTRKQDVYQKVLRLCKPLPYGRTRADYQEALRQVDDYQEIWEQIKGFLLELEQHRGEIRSCQEKLERAEDDIDTADQQKKREQNQIEELELAIQKAEEYLNRPENKEKAQRLIQLKSDREKAQSEIETLRERIAVLKDKINSLQEGRQAVKDELTGHIVRETRLRDYFEEELGLGLIVKREGRPLPECAAEALLSLRESDKGKNSTELTTALYRLYQQHSGSLTSYGTSLEDCFEDVTEEPDMLRKRQRIVSVWNGKKLYLEQFYSTLKTQIEETELLIQQKDRELFENILSRTLSQQLTGRIRESREWIRSMSELMQKMDTSMALSFSLEWKPKAAESAQELDTRELEKLLLRDKDVLTIEDIERLAAHFRSKIKAEKRKAEEAGGVVNYMELVREALDYRRWFEFQMYYYRSLDGKKPLTNAAFNKFSGGEKAMAMYVPLFAAVNAQYQKAGNEDHPRIITLDEAFAGVDDKNISTMFALVEQLDFDYIMNSQALWGCYETVPALRISELLRPANAQVVTVVHYTWNGHERMLDPQ